MQRFLVFRRSYSTNGYSTNETPFRIPDKTLPIFYSLVKLNFRAYALNPYYFITIGNIQIIAS